MALIKVVSPSGWSFDRPAVSPIKLSSRGLRGNDRADFLKIASHVFLDTLDSIKVAKDECPVHILALGASERWGPNRNGDAFTESTCRKYHPTFTKYAHWHRNHKNKVASGDPYYGIIKKSAYNDAMHRVELLGLLFKEKSAAERHGGLVADKEMEKIARSEDIPVSMACAVPYDECAWCGNKARTREEYCKAASCGAGGCADNLTRMIKIGNDVHIVHVKNPSPRWFDLSMVWRPADRMAYAGPADYLSKAAGDQGFLGVGGARLAQELGVTAPLNVILDGEMPWATSSSHAEQIKLAGALALLEQQPALALSSDVRRAFDARVQVPVDITILGEPGSVKCASGLAALAGEGIILSARDFARLVKKAELSEAMVARLPGVYTRLSDSGELDGRVASNPFAMAEKMASLPQRQYAARNRGHLSLDTAAVRYRCQLSSVRNYAPPSLLKNAFEKSAVDTSPEVEELARQYALYKVASLHHMLQHGFALDFPLTARIALVQNQVL